MKKKKQRNKKKEKKMKAHEKWDRDQKCLTNKLCNRRPYLTFVFDNQNSALVKRPSSLITALFICETLPPSLLFCHSVVRFSSLLTHYPMLFAFWSRGNAANLYFTCISECHLVSKCDRGVGRFLYITFAASLLPLLPQCNPFLNYEPLFPHIIVYYYSRHLFQVFSKRLNCFLRVHILVSTIDNL